MSAGAAPAWRARLRGERPWVRTALVVSVGIAAVWSVTSVTTLEERLLRDGLLFLVVPGALALAAGRDLGWRVDRRAAKMALLLTAVVLPFYVVGASLPSVRAGYPMGVTPVAEIDFLPRALLLVGLVVATETFYRGLLCVGIREVGPVVILISPVVYAVQHLSGLPIEVLLAAPADVLFGAADYHSRSLLPSIVAHGTGLLVLEWLTIHEPLVPPELVADLLGWVPLAL